MDTRYGILRIEIDGRWTADEMATSLRSLIYLYNLRLYLNSLDDLDRYWDYEYTFQRPPFRPPNMLSNGPFLYRSWDLDRFAQLYAPQFPLTISRIEYASPGKKDLGGIAGILQQIREFVQFLIMLPETKKRAQLENGQLRIENARNFVRLRREDASARAEIRQMETEGLASIVDEEMNQLTSLVAQKKIVSAEIVFIEQEPQTETENQ